jgi:hypothetical protein
MDNKKQSVIIVTAYGNDKEGTSSYMFRTFNLD